MSNPLFSCVIPVKGKCAALTRGLRFKSGEVGG